MNGRNTIVHLFEWKWSDIASECENFLGPKGFGGVQIAPPNENVVWRVNGDRPWWEVYQPVSYILSNRHGDEAALVDMIDRCYKVGVRIYPDIVVNHMAEISTTGTAGSSCEPKEKSYPGVPYVKENFHESCVMNYGNATSCRICELSGMPDLDQNQNVVREKIKGFMNHLIKLGVAGFRIDAAKHMWPSDLEAIFSSLDDLNTNYFPAGSRAFIYQEVVDYDTVVDNTEYIGYGRVCEFKYGTKLGPCFKGQCPLFELKTYGVANGLLPAEHVVAFVNNHDTQRDNNQILDYKDGTSFRAGVSFMLAHIYNAVTKVHSGYEFNGHDQGPPMDSNENIRSPTFNSDGTCGGGWVCEHRYLPVANMVEFRSLVEGTEMENWWDNGDKEFAFSRGDKGFYAVTVGGDINENLTTRIADGTYCDIMTGNLVDGQCTGRSVTVANGKVQLQMSSNAAEIVLAFHVNSKQK